MTALPHGDRFRRHAMKPSARTLLTLIVWLLLLLASAGELTAADFAWVNQREPPRPRYVWENREDVIYHDLSYSDKAVESAPEIAPFMGRIWVFNRAMQWHREPEGIVCYSAPATLMLTGADAVSTWHSDPANNITQDGQWTMFIKQSRIRRRDCAVLPAFQFHLEQNPLCELDVAETTDDWQFVVSVKGRGGPPLLTSDWQTGPAKIRFDLATALPIWKQPNIQKEVGHLKFSGGKL